MLLLSIPYNSDTQFYLLEEYMKSYIDVIASFCKDENKESRYIKGSIVYQEILLVQTLSSVSGYLEVNGLNEIFQNKEQCICDFNSYKQALLGELDYLKNKNRGENHVNLCEMPESLLNIIKKYNYE